MKIDKLDNIKMSLLKSTSELDENGKTDYESVMSINFYIDEPTRKQISDNNIAELLKLLYEDISDQADTTSLLDDNVDSVGVWLTYDGSIFENAIKIQTLNDMETHGMEGVEPIYEFCKMTIMDYDI